MKGRKTRKASPRLLNPETEVQNEKTSLLPLPETSEVTIPTNDNSNTKSCSSATICCTSIAEVPKGIDYENTANNHPKEVPLLSTPTPSVEAPVLNPSKQPTPLSSYAAVAGGVSAARDTGGKHHVTYSMRKEQQFPHNRTAAFPIESLVSEEHVIAALRKALIWQADNVVGCYKDSSRGVCVITFKSPEQLQIALSKSFYVYGLQYNLTPDVSRKFRVSVLQCHPNIPNLVIKDIFQRYGSGVKVTNHKKRGVDADGNAYAINTHIRLVDFTRRNDVSLPDTITIDLDGDLHLLRTRYDGQKIIFCAKCNKLTDHATTRCKLPDPGSEEDGLNEDLSVSSSDHEPDTDARLGEQQQLISTIADCAEEIKILDETAPESQMMDLKNCERDNNAGGEREFAVLKKGIHEPGEEIAVVFQRS